MRSFCNEDSLAPDNGADQHRNRNRRLGESAWLMYIFIIGNQRSGTTWLYQMLCAFFRVGYITNVAAQFPSDPAKGIEVSRRTLGDSPPVSFRSQYGNTTEPGDPHEFGWFWERFFNLEGPLQGPVDWQALREELGAMKQAWDGLPLVCKCAGMGFYASHVAREIPEARFVYIGRDSRDVAISTLEARRQRYGNDSRWYGFKPEGWEKQVTKPPMEQVAWQVEATQAAMNGELANVPSDRYMPLGYKILCKIPYHWLSDTGERFGLKPRIVHREPPQMVTEAEQQELIRLVED